MALASIDFTATPLPSNGQARSASALAAIYANIQSVYNAMAAGATNAPTANSVAQRGASGDIQFASIGLVPAAGALPALNIAAPTGYTGAPLIFSLNGVNRIIADAAGNLTAVSFIGPVTGNASTATSATTATALASPVLFSTVVSDYKAVTSGTAGHVNVSAGGAYADSAGNPIGPYGSPQDVNIVGTIAQPTGSNLQYIALSLPPGYTGANAVLTAGTVGVSPARPAFPTANMPIAMLTWRGAGTNPTGVFAAGDIEDRRFGGGGGTGGGGGGATDTTARAGAYWMAGTSATFPNALDATNAATNGYIHAALVRTALTDANILAPFGNFVSPDTPARIQAVGTAAQITAGTAGSGTSSPWGVCIGGRTRQVTSTVTSSAASGSSGMRYLVADVSAGTGIALSLPASGSVTQYQMVIANFWWDNGSASLQDTTGYSVAPDAGPVSGILSTATTLSTQYAADLTGSTMTGSAVTSWTKITNWQATNFRLTQNARLRISVSIWATIVMGTTISWQLSPLIYPAGGSVNTPNTFMTQLLYAAATQQTYFWSMTTLSAYTPGLYTLSMGVLAGSGGTGTLTTLPSGCIVEAEIWKA